MNNNHIKYLITVVLSISTFGLFIYGCSSDDFTEEINNRNATKASTTSSSTSVKLDENDPRIINLKNKISHIDYDKLKNKNDITKKLSAYSFAWDEGIETTQGELSGTSVLLKEGEDYSEEYCIILSNYIADGKEEVFLMYVDLNNKNFTTAVDYFTIEGDPIESSYIIDNYLEPGSGIMRLKTSNETTVDVPQILKNESDKIVYFKPEEDVTIDGKEYKNNQAYALKPGESTKVPIDGYKISGSDSVHKMTDGYSSCTINEDYNSSTDFYHGGFNLVYKAIGGNKKIDSFQKDRHTESDYSWDALLKK